MVGEDSSLDFPVREVGAEWKGNIVVHGLESLEDKQVAGRGGFNVVGESHVNNIDEEGWGKESNSIVVVIRMREKVWVARESIWTS